VQLASELLTIKHPAVYRALVFFYNRDYLKSLSGF